MNRGKKGEREKYFAHQNKKDCFFTTVLLRVEIIQFEAKKHVPIRVPKYHI